MDVKNSFEGDILLSENLTTWSKLYTVIAYLNDTMLISGAIILSGKRANEIKNKFINSTEILLELYCFSAHNFFFYFKIKE